MNPLLLIEKAAEETVKYEMKFSSWLMLLFGILVLIGGLLVCIRVAIAVDRKKRAEDIGTEGDA